MRYNHRKAHELRPIHITRHYMRHAEGSVHIAYGNTEVICTAKFQEGVPPFLKGKKTGWLTAEYGMLPCSTGERMKRESSIGKASGRTHEIQRLIGRSLRSCLDLSLLGENTLFIDCDVIQADGGTRTASITGACVALHDALTSLLNRKIIKQHPMRFLIAAVSVGIHQGEVLLDLDYAEDSSAETDMNIVQTEEGGFIELQGTAEKTAFSQAQLQTMLEFARMGTDILFKRQREALEIKPS